jgi:hypothetical protein
VPDGFSELGGFEFSSVFVLARSSPFPLQCVGSFCCFLHIQGQGVGHIVCVCVCLFGCSSSVRVFPFGRWRRLVGGREERAYRRLNGVCDWCVCAKFGWFGLGLRAKKCLSVCIWFRSAEMLAVSWLLSL